MVERSAYLLPMLPPCRVCGEKASGFHYGANTCEACKGFFRRSLQRKEPPKCNRGGKCAIKSSKRNACAHCRYKRCLDVGMSREAIKTGRYTHETKTKNIQEVKRLLSDVLSTNDDTSNSHSQHECENTHAELSPNASSVSSLDSKSVSDVPHSFGDHVTEARPLSVPDAVPLTETLSSEDADDKMHGALPAAVPDDVRTAKLEKIIADIVHVYKEQSPLPPDFFDLLEKRQSEFLEERQLQKRIFGSLRTISRDEYMLVYKSTGIDVDGRRELLEHLIPAIEPTIKRFIYFAKALPGFQQLPMEDQIGLIKASRNATSMILGHKAFNCEQRLLTFWWGETIDGEEMCKVHSEDYVNLLFMTMARLQKVKLSEAETCLFAALSIYCTDYSSVSPEQIETSQMLLLNALSHLVKRSAPDDHGKLARCLLLLPELRTLAAAHKHEEETMSMDWCGKIHFPPLFYEMWFT